MDHDKLRTRHFERLNSYRNSIEFAEYARRVGYPDPGFNLPSIIGDRWEIDAAIWDEFLGMMPPLAWSGNSFYMCEFSFGNITAKFTRDGERYFCEFARYGKAVPA